MPCFNPLIAWRSADPASLGSGKHPLVFDRRLGLASTEMSIPCGQCIGCRLDRAKQWAVRCMHEASMHADNCFLTLTYDEDHLPADGSLNKHDYMLFFKRLRKKYGPGIRYYQCGEYGELSARPHHHAIVFGFRPPDCALYSQNHGIPLYVSDSITALWGHGYVVIGDVSFDSCCYVARYVLKKVTGPSADNHYNGLLPEYTTMSRRPGIGRLHYDKYKSDMYNYDTCVLKDNHICRPPKYYDRLYDIDNPEHMSALKALRKQSLKEDSKNIDYLRMQTKEKHLRLTLQQKKRIYESTD